MLRCRKGDLAICNRTIAGEHVGHMVDVLEYIGNDWLFGHLWRVKTRQGLEANQPDDWMTPIRPDELKETEETEKEIVTTE